MATTRVVKSPSRIARAPYSWQAASDHRSVGSNTSRHALNHADGGDVGEDFGCSFDDEHILAQFDDASAPAVEDTPPICSDGSAATDNKDAYDAHASGGSDEGDSARAAPSSAAEDCHVVVRRALMEAVPLSSTEDMREMLKGARSAKEVRHILEHVVYRNHLCFDVLNGHGYRVSVVQSLTSIAPRTQCMTEWFECVEKFRVYGFVLTRTFVAEGLTTIRQWLTHKFSLAGRTPDLVTGGIHHIQKLFVWCREDRLVFDHVLYTRMIFLLTMIVSYFDRQNIFRSSFPQEFVKRDGIVVEWMLTPDRCIDFDECVRQCDAVVEAILEWLRHDIPSRPLFSIVYRLIDYYFATDNVEKMVATMEDAEAYGIAVAESSTAKLMQLACAQNYSSVPQLFLRWRASLPQCVIATPDISRILFFYGRSGGGLPCPLCGEPYNHRNVSVYVWSETPANQLACPALKMARHQKGELEEDERLPQNRDWSGPAFEMWRMSVERSIEWGAVEWRAFLLSCMFSPHRALEAKELLDEHFDHAMMDDFLRATYMRLLRHHCPESVIGTLRVWQNKRMRMSPIVLQEALMGTVSVIRDAALRLDGMKHVWASILEKDSYVMPFTKRLIQRRYDELKQLAAKQRVPALSSEEDALFHAILQMMPRHLSLLDMKDSVADFVVGTSRKNVYMDSASIERSDARRHARRER